MTVVPTGGAVMLQMPGYLVPPSGVTSMVISRAVSGVSGIGVWTQIYSGAPQPFYVDAGDSLPAPLTANSAYVWQVADSTGVTMTDSVLPSSSIISTPDYLTNLLIRLLQGGIDNLTLPTGIKKTQITTQMPQGGWQALPFVVVNLDLIQQTEVQIGEDVVNLVPGNDWTIWSNAKRIWRVSVFSKDVQERDFYRDSLLTIFRVLRAVVFAPIGMNVTHSFQASSGTDAKEWEGHTPGFYFADLMMELDGLFSATVLTNYGNIASFDINTVVIPNTGTIELDPFNLPS